MAYLLRYGILFCRTSRKCISFSLDFGVPVGIRSFTTKSEQFDCDKIIDQALHRKYSLDGQLPDFPSSGPSLSYLSSSEDEECSDIDEEESLDKKEESVFSVISRKFKEKQDSEGDVLVDIQKRYDKMSLEGDNEQEESKEEFEFLEVLRKQDRKGEADDVSSLDDSSDESEVEVDSRGKVRDAGLRLAQESTALVQYLGKDEVPNLCESKYCFINWEKLRKTIVDECVDVMHNRTEFTNLKTALEKWDGMVGNTLVAAVLLRMKSSDDALAFFKWASQQYSFKHDVATYGALIQFLVRAQKDYKKALIVYKHVERASIAPDIKLMELLIEGLVADGDMLRAVEFLDIMFKKVGKVSARACSSVIDGLFRAGEVDRACKLFNEGMTNLDCKSCVITCISVLRGLCEAGRIEEAKEFFQANMKASDSYDILISTLSSRDLLEDSIRYAELMTEASHAWTATTYAALIDVYGRAGRLDDATRCYQKMCSEKCPTDRNVFNCMLRALNREPSRVSEAVEVARTMIRKGYTPCAEELYQLVMKLDEEGVGPLFKKIGKRTKVADQQNLNQFVEKLLEGGQVSRAAQFYEIMTEKKIGLDSGTFSRLVSELCRAGEGAQAYVLFAKLDEMNVEYDGETHRLVFQELCRAGKVGEAYQVYGLMVKRSVQTDESMLEELLCGFCQTGDVTHALKVYEALLRRGACVPADKCKLLSEALYKAGNVPAAEKVAAEVIEKSLFQPPLQVSCST